MGFQFQGLCWFCAGCLVARPMSEACKTRTLRFSFRTWACSFECLRGRISLEGTGPIHFWEAIRAELALNASRQPKGGLQRCCGSRCQLPFCTQRVQS